MPQLRFPWAARFTRLLLVIAVGLSAFASTAVLSSPAQAATCPNPVAPSGTQISTPGNLQWVRDNTSAWSGTWTQTANIDMGGCVWNSPIGTSVTNFSGTYDGGHFIISGLTVNMAATDNAGLFGQVGATAVLRKVHFTGSVFGRGFVGGLVGYLDRGTVTESSSAGRVSGVGSVGGLVGYLNSGTIRGSYASGAVVGTGDYIGGLVGYVAAQGASVQVVDSFASGNVEGAGPFAVGGLIGYGVEFSGRSLQIERSYAVGALSGTGIGGLLAFDAFTNITVTASYWDVNTSGTTSSDGGTGKTTVEMQDIGTYSAWSIAEGSVSSKTWGICPDINGGYPFLTAFYPTGTCEELGAVNATSTMAEFTFLLPDGRECSSIGPMRVPVGSSVQLPGVDADCRTMPGSLVGGWTIPVAPGFTGAGSASQPFNPGHWVEVSDSQRFTVVPLEPVLTFTYDANVGEGVECVPTGAQHTSADGREMSAWVPRADVSLARFPVQASCLPDGHQLSGWNTRGDGSGDTYELGTELPEGWSEDPTNRRTMFAVWEAA